MNTIRTLSVEAGLPTLDEARRLVASEIRQRLPLTNDHHELLAPGDARVNQVPLEQQVLLRRERINGAWSETPHYRQTDVL